MIKRSIFGSKYISVPMSNIAAEDILSDGNNSTNNITMTKEKK
jgi:hypothetical protein